MERKQKIVAVTSIVLIAFLGILLAVFLWTENHKSKDTEVGAAAENIFQKDNELLGKEDTKNQKEDDVNADNTGSPEDTMNADNTQPDDTANADHIKTEDTTKTEPAEVSMVFGGDVLLGQAVLGAYDNNGIAGVVSAGLLAAMKDADITMVNQEFPFSTRGTKAPDKQYTFRVDPFYTSAITDLGIDVVSLANNHSLDYGAEALNDTFAALDSAAISYVGAGDSKERAARPVYLEAGGRKICFLGASRVIPEVSWNIENSQPGLFCTYDSAALNAAILEAKKQCDYVVVYVHWGIEKEQIPQEYQRTLAKGYIDAGADLVIGSHPHVLQGIEYYNGKPIIYSLGNFIFSQQIPQTMLLKVTITAAGETKLMLLPATSLGVLTEEMVPSEAAKLFALIQEISFSVHINEAGEVMPTFE